MERKKYVLNKDRIEIDITYECNLSCINCNRSCGHNSVKEYMGINQIQKFIDESISKNKKWTVIRVLGGEPTLHPQFKEISILLSDYIKEYSINCEFDVISNGISQKTKNLLKEVEPYYTNIINTDKKSNEQPFDSFNIAPIDTEEHNDNNYTNGCWITELCGYGLNMYGYYPCAVSASIDTFIEKDIGRKEIPDNHMEKELNELCRYCGHFNNPNFHESYSDWYKLKVDNRISPTWQKLYKNGNKPLSKY